MDSAYTETLHCNVIRWDFVKRLMHHLDTRRKSLIYWTFVAECLWEDESDFEFVTL